jgi:cytochrome c oxidase subunit I+III
MTESADSHHLPPKSTVKRWLVTTNHKDIGVLYILTSIFTLVLAGTLALLIRAQMWTSGGLILNGLGYNQVVSAHGLLMVFWFLSPFAFGLANYFVPLQIGADDLAFPRLNALSYWVYLFSIVLFGVSFFQGATFSGGWTMYAPLNVPTVDASSVTQIGGFAAILALTMFVTSVTLGSVNFLTTIYRQRAKGLRMRDIPLFSISILLTVWMMLFAFAALLAALVILSAEHLIGTVYFASDSGGSVLWTHLWWFFGHPEVYIVFFPALGLLGEIVQTFSGRRLVGRKWFVIALALVAIQSFIVWMHHMFLTTINLPIKTVFMVTTIGISLPFDLMVFALIYTMVKGRIRWKTPFLFALGALVIFIIGGITGVFLGAILLDYSFRGTYWVTAHFHYAMASAAVAIIGGIYYWFPKITGKMYNEFLGKAHFVAAFVGFNMLYFPMFVVWETPRRVFVYDTGLTLWHRVATLGAAIFAASFLLMFYNLVKSMYSDRDVTDSPWAYTGSMEWAVSSPPPEENFPGTPSYASGSLEFLDRSATDGGAVADGDAATDGGAVADATTAAAQPADHASWWPFLIGFSTLLTGIGLSGISGQYFVWPFLFTLPVFIAYLGIKGAQHDGFALIHGAYLTASFPLLALLLVLFDADHGFMTGLGEASNYFYITIVGTVLGAMTLIGMGYESFNVPEPKLAEQWPFGEVESTKLGMWTFIGSDIILFGALIGSYVFARFNFGWHEWWEAAEVHKATWPGLANTYILLASSFTIVLALVYAKRQDKRKTLGFLSLTFVGASVFMLNKSIEWIELFWHEGWTFNTDLMASTYYLTTGMHAAHVLVGMLIMLFLIARTYTGAYMGEEESQTIEYFGLYWHFVDIVWLFLFPVFYIL